MGTTWNYYCLVVFLFLENLALIGLDRTRLNLVIFYEMRPLVPLLDLFHLCEKVIVVIGLVDHPSILKLNFPKTA